MSREMFRIEQITHGNRVHVRSLQLTVLLNYSDAARMRESVGVTHVSFAEGADFCPRVAGGGTALTHWPRPLEAAHPG